MDCVGKHIYYTVKRKSQKKGKKEQKASGKRSKQSDQRDSEDEEEPVVKSTSVFLFAFQNAIDKRSYIKFYKFTNKHLNFQFEKETMFTDPIESLTEIDSSHNIYAIVFGGITSGYAIARADFTTYKLEVLSFNL